MHCAVYACLLLMDEKCKNMLKTRRQQIKKNVNVIKGDTQRTRSLLLSEECQQSNSVRNCYQTPLTHSGDNGDREQHILALFLHLIPAAYLQNVSSNE